MKLESATQRGAEAVRAAVAPCHLGSRLASAGDARCRTSALHRASHFGRDLSTTVKALTIATSDAEPQRPLPLPIAEYMQSAVDELKAAQGRPRGIATGFKDLDGLTGGAVAGALWVIAGRSGVGKSVLPWTSPARPLSGRTKAPCG